MPRYGGIRMMLAGLITVAASSTEVHAQGVDYPRTETVDTVDIYHGTRVADPFRWLEDQDSEATRRWVREQNRFTFDYLERMPGREQLRPRLRQVWNYPRYDVPQREAGRLFFSKNDGLQDQPVVYVDSMADGTTPRVLFDPNEWSEDGTASLSALAPGPHGRHVAYGKSEDGSDWKTLYVRDLATGRDLKDAVEWVKYSAPAWTRDGEGFYYARFPAPEEGEKYEAQSKGQAIYYHEVGTPQSEDRLVYERPEHPEQSIWPEITHEGRYLVLHVTEGWSKSAIYAKDLRAEDDQIRPLIEGFDARYDFVGASGSILYVVTTLDLPNGRIVAVDADGPDRSSWDTIIPESDVILQDAELVGGRLLVEALTDAKSRLAIYTVDGVPETTVRLPTAGTVTDVSGDPDHSSFYYGFASFAYPTTIFRYTLGKGASEVMHEPEVEGFDAGQYVVEQVLYESTDGTEVPMFVVHEEGLDRDGTNPMLLYGYGGFNITLTPAFRPWILSWLELGGVYAAPNLRGGGAYGEAWHRAGMLANKQQVFDDFAAGARFLVDANYTSASKLAIMGHSNGGLLTGASITQRPDLFGAAVVARGVLDMLRYHEFTGGHYWIPEYGSAEDPEQFAYLYEYSPVHNVEPGTAYPPTLVTTADTDDRVVPSHSYKFAAALQHAQIGDTPILLRVETETGHGGGTPTSKQIEEYADVLAFLVDALDVDASALPPAAAGSTNR